MDFFLSQSLIFVAFFVVSSVVIIWVASDLLVLLTNSTPTSYISASPRWHTQNYTSITHPFTKTNSHVHFLYKFVLTACRQWAAPSTPHIEKYHVSGLPWEQEPWQVRLNLPFLHKLWTHTTVCLCCAEKGAPLK